jgi:hypothetical protein
METVADTKIALPGSTLRASTVAVFFIFLVWACFGGWSSGTTRAQSEATYENIVQLHQALANFQSDQAAFPSAYQFTTQEILEVLYLGAVPLPQDVSGVCAKYPTFAYSLAGSRGSAQDYSLTFCLTAATQGLAAGVHTLSSSGVDVQASQ